MANRTVKEAHSIKGTNPQHLIEKIIRSRIYDSRYWKEECFALTGELLVDKGVQLKYIGGVYGGNFKPTPFICLNLKMLQIQPDKDIIIEFIKNEDYKYVRAMGSFYMRLTGSSLDVYKYLEPLYNDFRKIRRQDRNGAFYLSHMDEFIDELLHEERVCDVILPRLQKRDVLEQLEQLEPRVSALEDDLDEMSSEESEVDEFKADLEAYKSQREARGEGRVVRRSPSPVTHRTRRSSRERGDVRGHHREREMREGRDMMREGREMRDGREMMREGRDMREGREMMREGRDMMREGHERRRERDERGGHHMPPHANNEEERRHRHHRHHHHHHEKGEKEKKKKHKDKDKEKHRDKDRHKARESKKRKSRGEEQVDEEIREQNELRAKLGLPPLRK